ncbi:hypothetical protein GOBAR_DD21661 [Gossypium barbadense]|nr:hypothetical protein GOBAR_DD21661 [Gossypium barbadense]
MVDYMLNNPQQHQHISSSSGFYTTPASFDKLSFADVMQFADFGPKLALNQTRIPEDETGIDPSGYFLRFPVLNDKLEAESLMVPPSGIENVEELVEDKHGEDEARVSDNAAVQLRFFGEDDVHNKNPIVPTDAAKNKRKRPRTIKTSEEVESQRMTHIAVERNRRKQMNEHLRVLRSLMPGSYVQRGDQASIIGGAIEFVMEYETGLREETAENKSCLADVEVKLLGFDAMIKILCRRRPGQLVKTIAALEDLQLNILHTNITTIEQTVLYSFNVKVTGESGFSAEDIASSVQQIFSFIHANSSM